MVPMPSVTSVKITGSSTTPAAALGSATSAMRSSLDSRPTSSWTKFEDTENRCRSLSGRRPLPYIAVFRRHTREEGPYPMSDTEEKPEPVLVKERRGAVAVLRLNRPAARNALNPELLTAIGLGMLEAEDDPDVRAVVLTGTGEKAFCAGMDLRAFAEGGALGGDPDGMKAFARFSQGEIGVPVIGAANATAVAGGFELLLGCDVVVASEAASFGVPEVKRGLFAAGGGVFVSTRIPLAVALELTLTGDSIDAKRALSLGLINQVV